MIEEGFLWPDNSNALFQNINPNNPETKINALKFPAEIRLDNVRIAQYMFEGIELTEPITIINAANLTNAQGMFQKSIVPQVELKGLANLTNAQSMFQATPTKVIFEDGALASLTNIRNMFYLATGFDQDISTWGLDMAKITNAQGFIQLANKNAATFSQDNYVKFLKAFVGDKSKTPSFPVIDIHNANYCGAEEQRAFLSSFPGLRVNDGICPDTIATVSYDPITLTSGDVTATLTFLEKPQTPASGWTQSVSNPLQYTRVFSENTPGILKFTDSIRNAFTGNYLIANIDKLNPIIKEKSDLSQVLFTGVHLTNDLSVQFEIQDADATTGSLKTGIENVSACLATADNPCVIALTGELAVQDGFQRWTLLSAPLTQGMRGLADGDYILHMTGVDLVGNLSVQSYPVSKRTAFSA